jgi:hypothetical protein
VENLCINHKLCRVDDRKLLEVGLVRLSIGPLFKLVKDVLKKSL